MITLYPHQTQGAKYLLKRGGGYLFWEMRTGKTLASLYGCRGEYPVLILTKGSIMETFRKALTVDMGIPDNKVGVCHGNQTKAKRLKIAQTKDIVICNYEAVIPLRLMNVQEWKVIIFDESYALANISAKVTRYILRAIPKQPLWQIRIALSGSPASENPIQYATQFFAVDGQFMGYKDVNEYLYDNWTKDDKNKVVPKKSGHLLDLHNYIHKHGNFLTMDELGLGSEILYNTRYVNLNKAQLECLEWAKGRKAELNTLMRSSASGQGLGNMVYAGYENMVAAGIDPRDHKVINTAKIDDILDCFLDEPEPILILSHYKAVLSEAHHIFYEAGISSVYIDGNTPKPMVEDFRNEFQQGNIDVFIAQSEVAAEGLDFSRANLTYYLNNAFSLNTRVQTIMRTTNIKKKNPVGIVDMCTKDTIDIQVIDKLQKKEKISTKFLEGYTI